MRQSPITEAIATAKKKKSKLVGTDREDLAKLLWAQPTYSALELIPQMHFPDK